MGGDSSREIEACTPLILKKFIMSGIVLGFKRNGYEALIDLYRKSRTTSSEDFIAVHLSKS